MAFHNFTGEHHPIDGVDVLISASFGEGFVRKMARRNIKASIALSPDIAIALHDYIANGQTLPKLDNKPHAHPQKCNCNCGAEA